MPDKDDAKNVSPVQFYDDPARSTHGIKDFAPKPTASQGEEEVTEDNSVTMTEFREKLGRQSTKGDVKQSAKSNKNVTEVKTPELAGEFSEPAEVEADDEDDDLDNLFDEDEEGERGN